MVYGLVSVVGFDVYIHVFDVCICIYTGFNPGVMLTYKKLGWAT